MRIARTALASRKASIFSMGSIPSTVFATLRCYTDVLSPYCLCIPLVAALTVSTGVKVDVLKRKLTTSWARLWQLTEMRLYMHLSEKSLALIGNASGQDAEGARNLLRGIFDKEA